MENHNRLVKKNDRVIFLGDLAMKWIFVYQYFPRLNGRWFFIRGNHDRPWWNRFAREFGDRLEGWADFHIFSINKQKIVACHAPFYTWEGLGSGAWHTHGHSHNNVKNYNGNPQNPIPRKDVGIDANIKNPYCPFHYDEVEEDIGPIADKFKERSRDGKRYIKPLV